MAVLAGFYQEGLTDTNGKALKLASVAVKKKDGTDATLYSSATMGTTVANPTQADELGNVSFWTTNGEYDLVVTPQGGTARAPYGVKTSLAPGQAERIDRIEFRVYDVRDYGAKADGSDDRVAIQAALDAAASGGGIVYLRPGTYMVSVTAHPDNANYLSALRVPSNVTLMGAGPGATVIKLLPNQPSSSATVNVSVVFNKNINAVADVYINVRDLTIDGNGANQGTAEHAGITWIRARGVHHQNVVVKDCRGTGSEGWQEKMQFDAQGCADLTYDHCEAVGTFAQVSTGFSVTGCTKVRYTACRARGMAVAMGFTHNNCEDVVHQGCDAYKNANGFNSEISDNIIYIGCLSGGTALVGTDMPFASGEDLGNTGRGFLINQSTNVLLESNIADNNGTDGLFFNSGVTARVVGGAYKSNGNYGISFLGSSEETVRFAGVPILIGNAWGAMNTTTYGVIPAPPARLAGTQVPAVPASGGNVVNRYPFPVAIDLVGGTLTDVFIFEAGAASADSSGPVRSVILPPGFAIGPVYSAAPTWLWRLI